MTPEFLSAEPFATNLIGITTVGAVDFSTVKVTLNGKVRDEANHSKRSKYSDDRYVGC